MQQLESSNFLGMLRFASLSAVVASALSGSSNIRGQGVLSAGEGRGVSAGLGHPSPKSSCPIQCAAEGFLADVGFETCAKVISDYKTECITIVQAAIAKKGACTVPQDVNAFCDANVQKVTACFDYTLEDSKKGLPIPEGLSRRVCATRP